MDFSDIEFLMGNIKQETPTTTERASEPLVAGNVQNTDTDQLAMSTYMTDFILDYINRSLKVKMTDWQICERKIIFKMSMAMLNWF